ncbi:hypothetical protein lerEdw1_014963 [Lerista edwardsae]|nr:hypothetical protein lerEdw1_014963 [Lerista edwardsae]
MPGSVKRESFLVVNEDSNRLIFINKANKGVEEGCFTFDGVFSLDTGQVNHAQGTSVFQEKLFLEKLQALLAMVPLGYSLSLLMCEADCYGPQAQLQGFVQKVIETVLQETSPPTDSAQYLQTISFVQIYTDGMAQDLLRPRSQALRVMDVPPLGLVVEEATEIVVGDSQAATHFYLQGMSLSQSLKKSFQTEDKAICGNLLTVTMEKKVGGQGLQRATVRIFEFSGGDEQPCADPFLPLFWASSAMPLPAEAGFLPWILKHLLQENALTFLLLCLTLPDASGEEILSALTLAEKVRGVAKRVVPTLWDPTQETQKRRAAIGALRSQLFSSSHLEQDNMIIQLGKVLKELQVLRSQRWEKKKETSAAYDVKEDTGLEARHEVDQQHQDTNTRFSLAKARRQGLQEQHRLLIQQELLKMEEELAGQEKLPPGQQEAARWQKERALLTLRLEALQREQMEAERDLEELYQEHRQEAEAQKQHILQVFQAYRKQAEEQMSALERKYRKLLQESLQDAINLSSQNQQLRTQKQLACMERAIQTDLPPLQPIHESHSPS